MCCLFSSRCARVRFLLGGRHGDFKFVPPPGYAPCYEAVLPKDRLRIEPIKEYKHDMNGVRNLLGPTQSLSHTAFTPNPVDTVQVRLLVLWIHLLVPCSHTPTIPHSQITQV